MSCVTYQVTQKFSHKKQILNGWSTVRPSSNPFWYILWSSGHRHFPESEMRNKTYNDKVYSFWAFWNHKMKINNPTIFHNNFSFRVLGFFVWGLGCCCLFMFLIFFFFSFASAFFTVPSVWVTLNLLCKASVILTLPSWNTKTQQYSWSAGPSIRAIHHKWLSSVKQEEIYMLSSLRLNAPAALLLWLTDAGPMTNSHNNTGKKVSRGENYSKGWRCSGFLQPNLPPLAGLMLMPQSSHSGCSLPVERQGSH